MSDSPDPKPKTDWGVFRRVFSEYARHMPKVIGTLLAVLAGVVLGLMPPLFLKVIIDDGIYKKDLGVITTYSILTIVATILAGGVTVLYGWWAAQIGQEIMSELRRKLFAHLQGMSLRFFTSNRTGEIQTRLISDVNGVQQVLTGTLIDLLSNVGIVVSSLVTMLILDWRLTLLVLAMLPIFMVIGQWMGNFARDVRKGTQEQTGSMNSMMVETLSVSGILLTKTTGRTEVLLEKFDEENRLLAGWQVKGQLLQYIFFGLIRLITSLAPAVVYWLAGWLIVGGDANLSVGTITAFIGLQVRFFFPITSLVSLQVEIMGSSALFTRIFEYLDLPLDIPSRPGAKALTGANVRGRIEFEDVRFKYDPDSEEWTLHGVNFAAEPGQLIALVGPSGAGKTTLTYLIPRLYDVDGGSVKLDGVDVRDLTQDSLHQAVSAVTQETYLLHATIRENLLVAKPNATLSEMEAACRAAAIHDHIAGLENGYETIVGERGYKLSGGEKQRLAIARAILKDAPILILDEATSALDTHSERLIQDSLNKLMKGRTTFAIAHRLSTILDADVILVLEGGRLVEQGRHEELLAKDGLYASLYQQQFRTSS